MFCPQCGQELNDDARFCFSCGKRMDDARQGHSPKKNTKILVVILIAILIIAIAVACMFFFRGRSSHQDNVQSLTVPEWKEEPRLDPEVPAELPTETAEEIEEETKPQESTDSVDHTVSTEETHIAVPEGKVPDPTGIPLPSLSEEARREILEIYQELLVSEANAISYSLLDMLGDDIPELIISCGNDEVPAYYQIYFVLNNHALCVQGEIPSAEGDKLLGNDGKLLICRQDDYVIEVSIDQSLSADAVSAAKKEELVYTDTVLAETADNEGLLDLVLMGNNENTWYSGWVRFDGRDYFYSDKTAESSTWREENGNLYYLGDSGYVTHRVNQNDLETAMDQYCQGFMEAINHHDVSYLKNVTESYAREVKKMLDEQIYKYRTLSDYICSVEIARRNHDTGSITVRANIRWQSNVPWEGEKNEVMDRLRYITLVYQNGEWLVDQTREQL